VLSVAAASLKIHECASASSSSVNGVLFLMAFQIGADELMPDLAADSFGHVTRDVVGQLAYPAPTGNL
jgi:hypothetical protein